jgi:prepilin-type N-terminal cleavage/methylation domain-containing protein
MPPAKLRPGFTLLELVAVCAVLGILAAIALSTASSQIQRSRVAAENTALGRIAAAIQASFESTDLESTNIAALSGTVPSGVDLTAFSNTTTTTAVPATTHAADWFAKVARQLGDAPALGVAPTPALQPRVAAVLLNANHALRLLWEGPESETGQQRFLLVSLMDPAGSLILPAWPNGSNPQDAGNLALFSDTWNTDWTDPAAVLPASWIRALSSPQIISWQGSPGTPGRLWHLCVRRIVCPKFNVVVNNTHPTDNCYVYFNLNGSTAGSTITAAANAGTVVFSGVLGGRTIQAYRGSAAPPAGTLFSQFILRDHCEITLQD